MARRVSMPTADDLFRPTAEDGVPEARTSRARAGSAKAVTAAAQAAPARPAAKKVPVRRPSGRVKHDEKMTVYLSSDELLDLEHARLTLRRDLGMAVDRGRIVREAIALALEELEELGQESPLVRRLLGE